MVVVSMAEVEVSTLVAEAVSMAVADLMAAPGPLVEEVATRAAASLAGQLRDVTEWAAPMAGSVHRAT